MAQLLLEEGAQEEGRPRSEAAQALLEYLDQRLCVPRDMGAPAAEIIRALAASNTLE